MLNNLLEFSRLEQNSGKIQVTRFNLIELMEDITGMFQPFADEKKLQLKFQNYIHDPFFIETDYTVLKQILVNVISNAVKYTLDGHIEIHLKYDEQLSFSIIDTGVGIDKEDVPKIFKPFSRINNPLKTEGSGFGLYVTKGLVEALNGNISIESEKGKGTSITIRLPIRQAPDFSSVEKEGKLVANTPIYNRVLLFEDDASLGNMLREFLLHQGHRVKLCSNPRDVKGFIRVISSFDIVFTDMQMAGTTGNEILHEIRETGSTIPVWLMTAYGDYTTEKALIEGFTGFITKPVSMSRLIAILSGEEKIAATNSLSLHDRDPRHPEGENHPLSVQFPELSAMFDHDTVAIQDILAEFIETSGQDMDKFRDLIQAGEYTKAQQLCHRVHPFFVQLNAEHLCDTLRKMDSLRGQDESVYPNWKEELLQAVERIDQFRERIREEHLLK